MKYSYNWLKEISGTTKSPKELGQLLMLHAFEVEGIEENQNMLEGVIVGEILEIAKHPNADKLQLTKVNVGKEILSIVCGAHNISVGDKVPVALVGTKLPSGSEIKEAEIRGEKSFGMLCAEDELGLGKSHEGILLLNKDVEIGQSLNEILELSDAMIEIDILANRAHDALSHVGMGREIAALEGNVIDYDYDGLKLPKNKSKKLSLKIKDKNICSRYAGAVLENITVFDSPEWMKNRLKKCGIRPINNVVDATNYVMLEIGQPLHAFDLDKVSGMQFPISNFQFPNKSQNPESRIQNVEIIVRNAKDGEEIVLLDESVKKLSKDDIVIANGEKAIALAGVMGGLETGVDEKTTTIILESANFNAALIRKTRMNLGISSDAALRFEKEIDPNIAEKALIRVIEIIEHIANGELEGVQDEYPVKKESWIIKFDIENTAKLLGAEIPAKVSAKILSLLGIKISGLGKVVKAQIPTFRLDLTTQEDLIEEIGRVYGYEKIDAVVPHVPISSVPINEKRVFARNVKNILVGNGFNEMYNYSFYGPRDAFDAQLEKFPHLELEAPMSLDQSLMRISLVPNLLKNVKENLKNFKEFNIFEIGRTYLSTEDTLPLEKNMLVGAMVFEKKSAKNEKMDKRHESGFFEAKSILHKILLQLGIADHYYDNFEVNFDKIGQAIWHEGRSAEIKIEGSGKSVGFLGEVNPFVLEAYDINTRVVMFEFEMDKLLEISEAEREYLPIGKYPVVTRDISLICEKNVRVDEILSLIQFAGGDIVQDVDLFDAIDFSDNTTSFAFHVVLGTSERTLTGNEVEETMNSIKNKLENGLAVKIRK